MIQPLMFVAEYEETISALLAVIKQEDDDSFAQGDEVHRPEKPEAVKRIEDLHGLHCWLRESFSQASARSSPSSAPMQQLYDAHGVNKAVHLLRTPEFTVEDPELEMHQKHVFPAHETRCIGAAAAAAAAATPWTTLGSSLADRMPNSHSSVEQATEKKGGWRSRKGGGSKSGGGDGGHHRTPHPAFAFCVPPRTALEMMAAI
ncbi:hypothetical protein B296_00032195 [Ensete ventricosum]|uniref:Uncharacterized protein n=1 Tax=Ensete ventricosum TaxID=4639 RepID=A0A426ZZC6_ENSVE|nr:hypothetical protein B296_00032195 [Ensete ventricosum]